jgi:hypothetical protein
MNILTLRGMAALFSVALLESCSSTGAEDVRVESSRYMRFSDSLVAKGGGYFVMDESEGVTPQHVAMRFPNSFEKRTREIISEKLAPYGFTSIRAIASSEPDKRTDRKPDYILQLKFQWMPMGEAVMYTAKAHLWDYAAPHDYRWKSACWITTLSPYGSEEKLKQFERALKKALDKFPN